MTRRIQTNHDAIGRFVAQHAKCAYNPDQDCTIGVVDDRHTGDSWVRGGVIYTNYTGSAVWMHVAGRDETWITRDMLWAAFHYPFVQLGCQRIYGIVEEANHPAMQFDLKLGFSVLTPLPYLFASGPGLVVFMDRDRCRWLKVRPKALQEGSGHGWQRGQGTAAA